MQVSGEQSAPAVILIVVAVVILVLLWVRLSWATDRRNFRRMHEGLMDQKDPVLSATQRQFAESSWLRELVSAWSSAKQNKWYFLTFRFIGVAGALVLPVLASQSLGGTSSQSVGIATFVVSVAVAISAGAIQALKFGSEWAVSDQYAAALEAEGWAYFQRAGHYRDANYADGGAFQVFFRRIEALRRLRGERRTADIRTMAAEAAKEPARDGASTVSTSDSAKSNPSQKAAASDEPPLPDFGRD